VSVPTQASAARAIVSVPAQAKRGEVIEIKTLVAHPMETGFRRTRLGELITPAASSGRRLRRSRTKAGTCSRSPPTSRGSRADCP
jgi:hypothetical protein